MGLLSSVSHDVSVSATATLCSSCSPLARVLLPTQGDGRLPPLLPPRSQLAALPAAFSLLPDAAATCQGRPIIRTAFTARACRPQDTPASQGQLLLEQSTSGAASIVECAFLAPAGPAKPLKIEFSQMSE